MFYNVYLKEIPSMFQLTLVKLLYQSCKRMIVSIFYRAFTGKYYKTTDAGTYTCVVCEQELFSSETKFDSGCGWPAFSDVLDQGKVKLTKDTSHGESYSHSIESVWCSTASSI
jgi:peptide methionine sulfoxide reductase MsrB